MKNIDKTGILYGVGVGPGDPELVTLKAVRIVRECDTVILPAKNKEDCIAYGIMKEACVEIAEKELVCKFKIKTTQGSVILELLDTKEAQPLVDVWKKQYNDFENLSIRDFK